MLHRRKYKFKRRPYKHQVEAIKQGVRQLRKTGGFALLMEPRTGKTKTAIDIASIMHELSEVSRVLVLCPLGVMDVWVDEIYANCPEDYRITMWDRRGRKRQGLPAWGTKKMDWVIMNPDAFSTPGRVIRTRGKDGKIHVKRSRTRGGKFDILRALVSWQPQMIIVDESHRFKSPTAAKTRMLLRVALRRNVKYWLILTGTIQTKKKKVVDVYTQVKIMNPESPLVKGMTATDFKQEYSVWTERNGYPQWLRNKPLKVEKMRKLLHAEAFSVTRKEAYGDLPRLPDQIIPIELGSHTAEVYEQMALDMIARIRSGEITEASIRLVQELRLAQITSGLARTTPTEQHPDSRLVRIGRDKLDAFTDLASDWFEADEHVVVTARFRGDIQGLRQVGRKLKVPVFEIHGGIKPRDRTAMWKGFNAKSGPALFIGQPQAMSLGIDLRSASIFVWFSLIRSWVDFTQAEDRIALNPDPRSYVYLLARGTVDYLLYESLQEDGDIGRLVMRNPDRLWVPPS